MIHVTPEHCPRNRRTENRRTENRELARTENCYHPLDMHPHSTQHSAGPYGSRANVFGGAIIVQRHWDRSYLKYFVALGAGFMLATAIVEVVPASLRLGGKSAAYLVLVGYLIIHFVRAYGYAAFPFRRGDSQS